MWILTGTAKLIRGFGLESAHEHLQTAPISHPISSATLSGSITASIGTDKLT